MTIVLERVVIRGNTFRVAAVIIEYDGVTKFDPDSQAVRLLKPDRTQEGNDMTAPTKDGTGEYHQDIETPATGVEGEWAVEWEITELGKMATERLPFRLVA